MNRGLRIGSGGRMGTLGAFGLPMGAVSKPFVPSDIAGLQLWLDFSDITTLYQTNDTSTPVTTDGQTIGYVADKSGNSRHATQSNATLRPLYKVNQVNGKSAALYDGSNDVLNTASFTQAQPNTYVVVTKFTGTVGTNFAALFDGVGTRQQFWHDSPNRHSMYAGTAITDAIVSTNNTEIVSCIFNGASSKSWVNGTAALTGNNVGANGLDSGLKIGFSASIPFKGPYCEFLMFDGALSDANRVLVQNYLNAKWAVF